MINARYIVRLIAAFTNRFKSILFVSAFLGFLLFLTLRAFLPNLLDREVERIGLIGRYRATDLPLPILQMIGAGLTQIDASGVVIPSIAKSWETIDEGKAWKFSINDNIYWQDGDLLTADSLSFSFEDVEVLVPDSKTIIFKLKDVFAPFPAVLAKPVFKKGLLGTGEWKVENLSLSGGFIETLSIASKNNAKKMYHFYPTEELAKLAFKLGEIDIIEDLSSSTPFENWATAEVSSNVNQNLFVAVFFNVEGQSLLSDKKIRQALYYAIDKESFEGIRAISPIAPNSWGYNPQTKPYDFDIEHAKQLLASVDLPKEQKANLSIKLATTPRLLNVAEKIALHWKEIGVHTTVQVASNLPEDYQAYLAIYDIPSDPDQYSTWHSTQLETNITNYKHQRVDTLLEEGRQELIQSKRKQIYFDFQRFLLEDAPVAILYHPLTYKVNRK